MEETFIFEFWQLKVCHVFINEKNSQFFFLKHLLFLYWMILFNTQKFFSNLNIFCFSYIWVSSVFIINNQILSFFKHENETWKFLLLIFSLQFSIKIWFFITGFCIWDNESSLVCKIIQFEGYFFLVTGFYLKYIISWDFSLLFVSL